MSLEHLDDANPPRLDESRWERVQSRSRAITRRRRTVGGSASLATLVAIGVVVAASLGSGGGRSLRVTSPDSTTSSTSTSTTAPLDPNVWVTVELEPDTFVVEAGGQLDGTIVFVNHESKTVRLTEAGSPCAAKWAVVIGQGTTRPGVAFPDICGGSDSATFAPGVTRVPFHSLAGYDVCGDSTTDQIPKCLSNGSMPGLPTGAGQLWFVTDGNVDHLASPPPIPVQIVEPGSPR